MSRKISQQVRDAYKALPDNPGVYLFLDQRDYPLYIGKSINLKKRVASYLRENQDDMEERTQRMIHEASSIKHISTATELLALLLEDALIKKYLPIYNIKQKQFRDYQYVRISDDPYPRLERLSAETAINEGLFGPFRDRFFVDRLQEIFARYLGFRSCNESNPTKRCIQLDIGQCLGPCVLPEVEDTYLNACRQVGDFLKGNDPGVLSMIENEIRECIQELQFEHAQRLRNDLIFCDAFFNRQRFNHRFRVENLLIRHRLNETPAYQFEKGALKEVVLKNGRISRPGEQLDLFDLSICKEDDPRFLLDRANLVQSWLRRNGEAVDYAFGSGSALSTR